LLDYVACTCNYS